MQKSFCLPSTSRVAPEATALMRRLLNTRGVDEMESSFVLFVVVRVLTSRSELRLILVRILFVLLSRAGPVADLSQTVALAERLIGHVLERLRQLARTPSCILREIIFTGWKLLANFHSLFTVFVPIELRRHKHQLLLTRSLRYRNYILGHFTWNSIFR